MKRKLANVDEEDDPLDREIDFSNAHPNPFAARFGRNRNVRILAPDLLDLYPDSHSMNEALRTLANVAQRAVAVAPKKLSARRVAVSKPKRGKSSK